MTSSDEQTDEQLKTTQADEHAEAEQAADGDEPTGDDAWETPVATYTLLAILVLIGGGYALITVFDGPTAEPAASYNGFEFTRTETGFYETRVNAAAGLTALEFREHPGDVENISMSPRVPLVIRAVQERNGSVTLSVDETYAQGGRVGIALYEISKITNYMFGINTSGAVLNESLSDRRPAVTCADVTPRHAVIRLQAGNTTQITEDAGCITITASSSPDVIRAADRLVYGLLGIIE
jgi:hypothetical protein